MEAIQREQHAAYMRDLRQSRDYKDRENKLRVLGRIKKGSVLTTQYFQKLSLDVQLIVPKRRIQFTKFEDGRVVPTPGCSFDCLYYCWNVHLPKDIVFLRE